MLIDQHLENLIDQHLKIWIDQYLKDFEQSCQGRPEACTPYTKYRGPGPWGAWTGAPFFEQNVKIQFWKKRGLINKGFHSWAIRPRQGILSIEFKTGPLVKGPWSFGSQEGS